MKKISLFKNSFAEVPSENLTLEELLKRIKNGTWKTQVQKVRETGSKQLKEKLPAVTISGEFKNRNKDTPLEKKLIKHSGYICIDIDAKDNPKLSTGHVIDHECAAQFVSCRGEGLKIIYKCAEVNTQEKHWRIYDAIEERLKKKKLVIKIDSIVKSISSLQYVTYDPEPYINTKTKLVVKPLPPIKIKKKKPSADSKKELQILHAYIEELGNKDLTEEYEVWNNIAFGLTYSLGEEGREVFHLLSKNYKGYSRSECDEKYDSHLQRDASTISRPITLGTVYDILAANVKSDKAKKLQKQKGVAVGVGEGEECPDMAGMVQYKLFLFKKILDKDNFAVKALVPHKLNPIAFAKLLMSKGIYRYENAFVRINENIVEKVDTHTILWEISRYIEKDGNYEFTYKGEQFVYSWEDLFYLWSTIKGLSSIYNTISSDVVFWEEKKLLKDTPTESYIPYQNGVVKVTANKTELISYLNLHAQVWKERILPRDYTYTDKRGMFEDFFCNVMGRGKKPSDRLKSEEYKRGLWYFGYMLQGTKDPATARAWMLYDVNVGNNGRSGKSIIGQALGKIRFVTVIDGKQVDFRNRFWLQTVKPWTDIIFIDDPRANTSILPMFNMITGMVQADRKGLVPLEIWPKFLFASNWIMEADGSSEADRQFISQLDNYYTEYAKKHDDTITPIVHAHGKRFFTEWDSKDWSQFDSFCVRALQYHFKVKPPTNVIIGDSQVITFKQRYGEEAYQELNNIFNSKADFKNKIISRDVLINAIKDSDSQINNKNAGTIARYFLKCMKCGSISVSTTYNRGMAINVYKWDGNPTVNNLL